MDTDGHLEVKTSSQQDQQPQLRLSSAVFTREKCYKYSNKRDMTGKFECLDWAWERQSMNVLRIVGPLSLSGQSELGYNNKLYFLR